MKADIYGLGIIVLEMLKLNPKAKLQRNFDNEERF